MLEDKTFYKIGTLARKSGVSPALLRAWEKRYALWEPERGLGGQRLYSQENLNLVCFLAEGIEGGRRIGELAAQGREQLLRQIRKKDGPGSRDTAPASGEVSKDTRESYINPLLSAAENVDALRLRATLDRSLLELSPDGAVREVFIPAMILVGEAYLAGRISVAGEHLVSSMVEHYLHNCIDQARKAIPGRTESPVICSCFPGEEHRLGLLAVAYVLAREGCNVVFLGAALPLNALEQAIEQLQPASVWLSVTLSAIYRKHRSDLATLVGRHPLPFVVGGQGVPAGDRLLQEAGCKLWPPSSQLFLDIQGFIRREVQ